MKTSIVLFTLLFGVIIFVTESSARPNHKQYDSSLYDGDRVEDLSLFGNDRDYGRRGRRTRHSRQIAKRYDYLLPWSYENDMILQEIHDIKQVIKELPDSYKNRYQGGSSERQLIFIPVPIYLPTHGPQCSSGVSNNGFVPVTNNRINIDSESNPIWGFEPSDNGGEGDDDGARPISFIPVKVNNPQGTPPPPVEHGSAQAGVTTTAAPSSTKKTLVKEPLLCEGAIIWCCSSGVTDKRSCFKGYGCIKTYETGIACSEKALNVVISHFKEVYGPRQISSNNLTN